MAEFDGSAFVCPCQRPEGKFHAIQSTVAAPNPNWMKSPPQTDTYFHVYIPNTTERITPAQTSWIVLRHCYIDRLYVRGRAVAERKKIRLNFWPLHSESGLMFFPYMAFSSELWTLARRWIDAHTTTHRKQKRKPWMMNGHCRKKISQSWSRFVSPGFRNRSLSQDSGIEKSSATMRIYTGTTWKIRDCYCKLLNVGVPKKWKRTGVEEQLSPFHKRSPLELACPL